MTLNNHRIIPLVSLATATYLCFVALHIARSSAAVQADHPLNVLLIVADDLNTSLGCYGNSVVHTPNIDRLAARGVRFDRAYVQAPLCNPSRASFLSGLRPDTTGVFDLKTPTRTNLRDHVFLPQRFRNSGYYTAMIGKIYHTGERFEDPASWDLEIREFGKEPSPEEMIEGFDAKGLPWKTDHSWKWAKLRTTDSETPDGQVALRAVDVIEKTRPVAKPFFLSVGFRRPHSPYAVPAGYFDRYPTAAMLLPNEPPGHVSSIPRLALTYDPAHPVPPERAREVIGAYYASITFVDAQVGLILAALDRNQLWENTIVVFMGDHGYHLGEHGGMWHKQSLFEESVRAPLIIVGPGIKANGISPRPVEFLNLYPTLAKLTGLSTPRGLQGVSMVPLLKDPRAPWDHPAFSQIDRGAIRGRTVRTERWRYTEWGNGESGKQLYDHSADAGEFVNLADDPRHAATVARLSKLLQKSATALAKNAQ